MQALVLIHHPEEGPGLLKEILTERGWSVRELHLWKGEGIPEGDFQLLILMGGPMSVNDEAAYPFLKEEKAYLRQWLLKGRPTLGICLGAQLTASTLGAKVHRGPVEEIGWYKVSLTEEGQKDPCFKDFPKTFPVFQWHEETFDLPRGAILLATSPVYPHQAFRFGPSAYALQFHLEVTEEMIMRWLEDEKEERKDAIFSGIHRHLPMLNRLCRDFLNSFTNMLLTD